MFVLLKYVSVGPCVPLLGGEVLDPGGYSWNFLSGIDA